MIHIQNVLRIKEFGYDELKAIKMMADQLSRVSYAKKPMILYLEGTHAGDIGGFDLCTKIEPRRFASEKCESNVEIITVSSGNLDIVGTCLAMLGDKCYATKDAKFTLNPKMKVGTGNIEPESCIDYDCAKSIAKGLVDWDTSKALDLVLGNEFGVKKAISLGIINGVIDLSDFSEDKDCTEAWDEIYGWTFWDL